MPLAGSEPETFATAKCMPRRGPAQCANQRPIGPISKVCASDHLFQTLGNHNCADVEGVHRQRNWDRWVPELEETLARLVGDWPYQPLPATLLPRRYEGALPHAGLRQARPVLVRHVYRRISAVRKHPQEGPARGPTRPHRAWEVPVDLPGRPGRWRVGCTCSSRSTSARSASASASCCSRSNRRSRCLPVGCTARRAWSCCSACSW